MLHNIYKENAVNCVLKRRLTAYMSAYKSHITCCFDEFWWLALINVVNKEEKDLTCMFLDPHGSLGQFHWPCGDDRRYVPLNKVIMKIQTSTTSANGKTDFITEEKKKQNYFGNTSV